MEDNYDIKDGKILDNEEGAIQLIDNLISCKIPDDDNELKEYVKKLQTHNHTQSCMKYDGNCRYGFGRFPNEIGTIIAGPPPDDTSEHKVKEYQTTLKRAQELLQTSNEK